ncbi:MAG: RecX family transcriptional regulator [Clostridia bacterium]|nr:RecX family transcriptional regulator [Clostridia bacterium]
MIYSLEEFEKFDKMKSKVLKYVLYKKRTEQEVRQKFAKELEEKILNDIIEELKENSYIDDYNYIERAVNEYTNLKSLSIKEIKYKLYSKGIKSSLIDEYISKNIEDLREYEEKSACKIFNKKIINMEEEEIRNYLLKKGYREESVKAAYNQN